MQEKHPDAVISADEHFDSYVGVNVEEILKPMSVFMFEDYVAMAVTCLRGGTGPCSVMGSQLKGWLLRHKIDLLRLRDEMAA